MQWSLKKFLGAACACLVLQGSIPAAATPPVLGRSAHAEDSHFATQALSPVTVTARQSLLRETFPKLARLLQRQNTPTSSRPLQLPEKIWLVGGFFLITYVTGYLTYLFFAPWAVQLTGVLIFTMMNTSDPRDINRLHMGNFFGMHAEEFKKLFIAAGIGQETIETLLSLRNGVSVHCMPSAKGFVLMLQKVLDDSLFNRVIQALMNVVVPLPKEPEAALPKMTVYENSSNPSDPMNGAIVPVLRYAGRGMVFVQLPDGRERLSKLIPVEEKNSLGADNDLAVKEEKYELSDPKANAKMEDLFEVVNPELQRQIASFLMDVERQRSAIRRIRRTGGTMPDVLIPAATALDVLGRSAMPSAIDSDSSLSAKYEELATIKSWILAIEMTYDRRMAIYTRCVQLLQMNPRPEVRDVLATLENRCSANALLDEKEFAQLEWALEVLPKTFSQTAADTQTVQINKEPKKADGVRRAGSALEHGETRRLRKDSPPMREWRSLSLPMSLPARMEKWEKYRAKYPLIFDGLKDLLVKTPPFPAGLSARFNPEEKTLLLAGIQHGRLQEEARDFLNALMLEALFRNWKRAEDNPDRRAEFLSLDTPRLEMRWAKLTGTSYHVRILERQLQSKPHPSNAKNILIIGRINWKILDEVFGVAATLPTATSLRAAA